MINKNFANDLEDLLNGSLDPSLFPYKKGNSIRIGNFAVRSNKRGYYKVYDLTENRLVSEMFCKTSAVALAKAMSKGKATPTSILKLDKELQKWYNDCVFYKNTMTKTKDPVKAEITQTRYEIAKIKTTSLKNQLDRFIYA